MKKRIISALLSLAMITGIIPAADLSALAVVKEAETISDDYISVSVSKKNGGFTVKTTEGNRLKKSDNNKDLLYHDGKYDTSFLSFRVGEGKNAKDYIFGGDYEGSSDVSVTAAAGGDSITAVWSVDGLTFTETLSLTNTESTESGMVSVDVSVANSGAARKVQARLLLDTCLGDSDYGYYQYTDKSSIKQIVTKEQIIDDVPQQLYATDDPYSPAVAAYTIHSGTNLPSKAAFGHWSHLASTLFDFDPVETLDFTNYYNEYLTGDSAYALYYDLGNVTNGKTAALTTFYGVYSNHKTPAEDSVAVNITAPVRLELNKKKTDFVRQSEQGMADFEVSVDFANVSSDSENLSNIRLVVQTSGNLRSLTDDGTEAEGQEFQSGTPFIIPYDSLTAGSSENKKLYFEAQPSSEAHYERITIGVYTLDGVSGEQLAEDCKLGERIAYILLPGTENDVPSVNFAAMSPKIIYTEGTRHLFVTVNNEIMLDNRANWNLKAYTEDGKTVTDIPHENISFNEGVMEVALTEDMVMAAGGWYLQLEWTDTAVTNGLVAEKNKKQSAPELHFTVSDDPKYKNDSYGVLAVVEYDIANSKNKYYRIVSFADEDSFEEFKADMSQYSEIVLTFKGEFTATKKSGKNAVCYTAVSTKTRNADGTATVDNPIVVNDCLDFEGGTVSVYYEDYTAPLGTTTGSAVCTEFDGELYTNTARTVVYKGKAALTKLKQNHTNYSLAVYDEDGNRGYLQPHTSGTYGKFTDSENGFEEQGNEGIYLIWASTGEIGQRLSGMIFNFSYGQFGTMYDTDSYGVAEEIVGNVISFAAALDMTFIQGDVDPNAAKKDTYWSKLCDIWKYETKEYTPYRGYDEWLKLTQAYDWSTIDESENKNEMKVSASVMVRDVVFGCGEGFVGVNFSANVYMKNYISGLPELNATLTIQTINNWSYGVEGEIDLGNFTLEAQVSIKSKNNVPVPDELYVFVSGFEPGINIDGVGAVWITGGGGGIENLYDSIFCTGKIPPLKLLLSVSFDVVKLFTCDKATLALGPTGISISAEKIGIKAVPGFTAIDKMGLSLEWYPGIDLNANISVNLFQGVIRGGGYIVLLSPDYKDVFFEMFAHAMLMVPNSVPVVGGMQIAGVDLGISTERIWGAIEVLFITLGVTYYWGEGDIDFSSGSKASPTFPELLGYDGVRIGYDAENDRTLFARVGTNTQMMATTLQNDGTLKLMANSPATLKCLDGNDKDSYMFNLGKHTGSDALVQISFDADDLTDAKSKASGIKVGSAEGENDFGTILYDGTNLSTCNANLSFNSETKKAVYAFTVTDEAKYNKEWYITAPNGSDVCLYNVAEVPKVESVGASVSGSDITLTWTGSELSELDQISFYLCESNNAEDTDPGYRIDVVDSGADLSAANATLAVPSNIPSGEYYVRAVYSKADEVNGVVFTSSKVTWENSNTPGTPNIIKTETIGDLYYELTIEKDSGADGYFVTVYDADGNATDFERMEFDAEKNGDTVIRVGGSHQITDPTDEKQERIITYGLNGGENYIIGVIPYKTVVSGGGKAAVYGKEKKTSVIYLPKPVTPTVEFSADKSAITRVVSEISGLDENNKEIRTDVSKKVYNTDSLTLTADISENASGTWKLDNGNPTEFSDTESVAIQLSGLTDGEHSVTISGNASDGDGFTAEYAFTVDTMPPQLLLSSPVNGSFFGKDGTVTLTGVTDADARFTVTSDGTAVCTEKTIGELGGTIEATGVFSVTLNIPDPNGASQRTLNISVSDDIGNTSHPTSVTISHGGLSDLVNLEVMVNGKTYSNGNVSLPAEGLSGAPLALSGETSNGVKFLLSGCNISWDVLAVSGSASENDGKLSAEPMSQGIVTGKIAVSDNAFRSAAICFGAPAGHTVATSSNVGGTVVGGGEYKPGDTVTLTATPDKGYRFVGWAIVGADCADKTSEKVNFKMPDVGNVTAEARFEPYTPSASGGTAAKSSKYAKKGETVKVKLPDGKTEKKYLPYYFTADGEKRFVPISAVKDGYVVFIAPCDGDYFFSDNPVSFGDIKDLWSEENIIFAAEREIFNGIGDKLFEPETAMNRAMFVTVLYRLAGSPKVSGNVGYSDADAYSWYSDAIVWGQETGIAEGYGGGVFGVNDVITREQMCVMMKRFIEHMGYDLPSENDGAEFEDADVISDWAREAVDYCRTRGLVNGQSEGIFAPFDNTTRGQCCAVMERMIRALIGTK